MVNIKDVAGRAGVSLSTASRVLRQQGYVSADVRERVERAARDLHYVPNDLARSLRGRATGTIGVLVYDLLNPYFANIAAGVEDASYERGFNVILGSTQPWHSPEREASYMQMLLQKRIDGLAIQHLFSSSDYAAMLQRQGIPAVRVVSPQAHFDSDLVTCDTKQAAYNLVTHLAALGHRRIAALGPQFPSVQGEQRLAGYRDALADAGLEARNELVMLEGWRTRDGYTMCCRLLEGERPDALFAFGPRIAVGVAWALREQGVRIPEDIALVCMDDFGMGSELDPFMTVARQPEHEMGRHAAQFLIERILGSYSGPPRVLELPASLIIRRSCGTSQPSLTAAVNGTHHVWEDD